ncbi:MAG: spore maturation protein [Lachnospiraceae bacterium]|nr:spore maturation protein [Lachnospiraceae bacterium]
MYVLLLVSKYAIPVIIGYIVLYGMSKKVSVYDVFLTGVKDGFKIVIEIAPTLVGLLMAVGIFRSSGFLDIVCNFFTPLTNLFNIPSELLPVSLVRMFSSSAATGMTLDIFKTYGPDSTLGNSVSIMMSSTETIFYTMSVYFLAIGVKKTRWTLPATLICTLAGFIVSIFLGQLM